MAVPPSLTVKLLQDNICATPHSSTSAFFLEEKNEGKKIEKLSFLVPYTEIKVCTRDIYRLDIF